MNKDDQMTVLDKFAAFAMQGILANNGNREVYSYVIADEAYELAWAMVTAKSKQPGQMDEIAMARMNRR